MTRIFLSHSSQDNPRACAVAEWLRENGWEDYFLDIVPRQGIAAGEAWKVKIHDCMDASAAGIFLISRSWLASRWCQTELMLAYNLNKLIFGVVVDDLPRDQIPELLKSNWQVIDLQAGRDHQSFTVTLKDGTTDRATLSRSGLASLKEGLHRAAIAPEAFVWPPEDEPDREPWRGLSPMEPEDAGIFFGREAQTARALDTIRALREGNPPRLLAIVGASGAGKSSFLRAGLIPRLRRDDRNYLTLPPIRPEGGALDAFAKSLEETAKQKSPRALGDIRRIVHAAAEGAPEALSQFLTELAQAHRLPAFDDQPPPVPTILLPIDQGEELFQSSGRAQGGPFLSLLAHLLRQDSPKFLAAITIRSDSYEALQNAPQLSGLNHSTLSLPAIAKGEYSRIITGPIDKLQSAGRKFDFDPAITDTLLAEFDKGLGRDALPLLAFTLDRLYRDFHGARKITLDDYKAMGGIAGSIDAAVQRALEMVAKQRNTPNDPLAAETLLRRTMIPWFAGIDPETGTARRNVSARDQLPPETLPLVDALIDQRLLTSDGNVIEPAHEALLREWQALNGWLVADREKLTTLEALRRAAADWQAKRRRKDYLAHKAGRLEEAERLADRPDLWQQLGPDDRAYLVACRAAFRRQSFLRKAVAAGFAAVVALGVIATGYQAQVASEQAVLAAERGQAAQFAEDQERAQAEIASVEAARAAQSRVDALALLALSQAETNPVDTLKLALGAWPEDEAGPFPTPSVVFRAISTALANTRPNVMIRGHERKVYSVAFSPDGRRIVSGGEDGTVRLWDAAMSAALGEPLSGHEGPVSSVAFSPDGRRIVSGSYDGTVRLWDATAGAALGEPFAMPADSEFTEVRNVAFSPDGSRIVSGGSDGTLRLWDAATGAALGAPLRGHENRVTSVAFSPDGSRLVSASWDGTLRLWDAATGAALCEPVRGDAFEVRSAAFSPEGSRIVSGGSDRTLRLWDAATGVAIGEPLRGHEDAVSSVAFSPDGRRVVSGSWDGTQRLWDAATGVALGEPLRVHESAVLSLAFSPNTDRIVSGGEDGTLRLWDASTGAALAQPLRGHERVVLSVAFSPDGSRIVSGSGDDTLRLWDAVTRAALGAPLHGHEGPVNSVAFSPEGSRIVSGGSDRKLRLWDAGTGAALGEPLRGHEDTVSSVAFSPEGSRIVSGGSDRKLRLWDAGTGAALGEPLRGHEDTVSSVAFSPDGRRIVSGGDDRTLRLWDAATGAPLGEPLRGHEGEVTSVAFSPDGRRVVSGSWDDTLRLWDAATGAPLGAPLYGHEDGVRNVAFSPDGSRIVSGGGDSTLRLWDAATGAPLGAPLRGHEGGASGVTFSPDGRRIVSGGGDRKLRLWGNLPPGNILQVACRYLPHINGRPDTSTEGLADEIDIKGLTLPEDCDTYDPPLPPEFRR